MLRTILVGRHLSIQGIYVRTAPSGLMTVRVGNTTYTGRPVARVRHAA